MLTYPEIVKKVLVPVYHIYKPYLLGDVERDIKKLKELSLTVIPYLIINRDDYLHCSSSVLNEARNMYPYLMNSKSSKRWLDHLELMFVHLRSELNEYSRDCVKGAYDDELPLFGVFSHNLYYKSELKNILEGKS